jgi:hypothetical protein
MQNLNHVQVKSINKLSNILESRFDENILSIKKTQQDDETGSTFLQLKMNTKKIRFWLGTNGSASTICGKRILLKDGVLPNRNLLLDLFVQDKFE